MLTSAVHPLQILPSREAALDLSRALDSVCPLPAGDADYEVQAADHNTWLVSISGSLPSYGYRREIERAVRVFCAGYQSGVASCSPDDEDEPRLLAEPLSLPGACCDLAEPISCVCSQAFRCPKHGLTHLGTHD